MLHKLGEMLGLVAPRHYNVHVDRGSGQHCVAGPYSTREEALSHCHRLSSQDHPTSKYAVVQYKGVKHG